MKRYLFCRLLAAAVIAVIARKAPSLRNPAGWPGSSNDPADVSTLADSETQIRVVPSCGNAALDRAMRDEMRNLAEFFDVRVSMAFYDDSGAPQAFATNHQVKAGDDGTLFIGCALVNATVAHPDRGTTAVAGILSHEMAHVLQFQRGLPAVLGETAARERQADFLAGYYLAREQRKREFDLKRVAAALYAAGDHHHSHGTPEQRVAALLAGYAARDLSLDQAFRAGLHFALGYDD